MNSYTPSSSNRQLILYVAAVSTVPSKSILRLSTLTSKLKTISENKKKPKGHPNSAATSIFISEKHKHLGKEYPHKEVKVGVANINTMNSVITWQLQISPKLPAEAQKGHEFNIMDQILILVSVLCDAECKVVFEKDNVQVFKDNRIIIEGLRDSETNLWLMPL